MLKKYKQTLKEKLAGQPVAQPTKKSKPRKVATKTSKKK